MPRILKRHAVSVWLQPDEATRLRRVAEEEGLQPDEYLAKLVRQIIAAPDFVEMRFVRVNKDDLVTIKELVEKADDGDEAVSTWLDVCVCIAIDRAKRLGGLILD